MQKIVINACFGGFHLSEKAEARLRELGDEHTGHRDDEFRDCPLLVQVVEELGEKGASDALSELKVIEIPDGVEWEIEEYDGNEWVSEKHRKWDGYTEP